MEFGTGAVKVTPAHDLNDNACGKRNNLETIIIFTGDGKITDNCGEFSGNFTQQNISNSKFLIPLLGLMRYDARISIENALKAKGLFRGKEPNKMRLGLCSRSGDIIEPMITPQWLLLLLLLLFLFFLFHSFIDKFSNITGMLIAQQWLLMLLQLFEMEN